MTWLSGRWTNIVVALLLVFSSGLSTAAQSNQPATAASKQEQDWELNTPSTNEDWMLWIDFAALEVERSGGTYLIAVARLGKGETSDHLNRARLERVQKLLTLRLSPVKLIATEGDQVPELGRIELYVCNQLYGVVKYEKDSATALKYIP